MSRMKCNSKVGLLLKAFRCKVKIATQDRRSVEAV